VIRQNEMHFWIQHNEISKSRLFWFVAQRKKVLCIVVAPTCFGITLPSSGSVPMAFWEMLNWGAVDRILWIAADRHAPRH
jgi:hypothetical protein